MARKKDKQREPYRKSSRMGKRAVIPFLIPLIFIALTILLVVLLIKSPEICLFGNCWRLVPLRWSKAFLFWIVFLVFFLVQALVVYIYIKVIGGGMKYANRVIIFLKNASTNIEGWFLKISH
jgi:sterol desaturase/sphingolipid hydroxylase (fatty acid hydroxylase superfamily)